MITIEYRDRPLPCTTRTLPDGTAHDLPVIDGKPTLTDDYLRTVTASWDIGAFAREVNAKSTERQSDNTPDAA